MKGTDHFKRTIQMYLEQRAEEDTLFAKNYRNPYKWYDLSASGVHNAPRNYGMPNLSVSGLSGVVSCFGQELLFQICFSVS